MTGILKVDNIQNSSGTSAMAIDSAGNINFSNNVANGVRIAVYRRYTQASFSSGLFNNRPFDSEDFSNISGTSIDGNGYANIPAGTYLIKYETSCVNDAGSLGETVSRVSNVGTGIVSGSYSTRSSSVNANETCHVMGSFIVTFTSTAQLVIQTLSENGGFDDQQTFDGSPGNTLSAADGKTSVLMTVIKLV